MAENVLEDAEISRGCRQNDPTAWHHLVRRYTPLVYRVALRMLNDEQAAEDAAQEVFMMVHRAIATHDPTRPLAPWLARITYNACLKRLAQAKRRTDKVSRIEEIDPPEMADTLSPESQVTRRQAAQQIERALERLSAQDRAMIVMRYREGFSDSEIAGSTRMPVGTVKTRLHRARNTLRKYLTPFIDEVYP